MSADPQTPPRVIYLTPTEMTGDWPAEVARKLVEQGLEPQAAAQIAVDAEAEMRRRAEKEQAKRGPSVWQRVLRFVGLAS